MAVCAVGLGGCFSETGDLGWDHDGEAGAPGSGGTGGTGATSSTGGTTSGGQPSSGGSSGTTSGGSSGSGGTGASCSSIAACGGDVVGEWTVTSSCLEVSGELDLSLIGLGCMSAPVTGLLQVAGTWTANSNGTYSDDTITSGEEQIELSATCLSISGTIVRCEQLGPAIQMLGYSSATCTPDASGGCACNAQVEQSGSMGAVVMFPSTSGDYVTSGNVLTTSNFETVTQYSYCASATELSVKPLSNAMGTLTGAIQFEKQ
jgi:hypothetical protein